MYWKFGGTFSVCNSLFYIKQLSVYLMISLPFFAGTAASVLHVVSGPDHLAAVTPLAIETRRKVWRIGLYWGFGHLTGMLLIGVLFLLFKEYIPLEKISEHSEQLVGFVLIAIGVWALISIFYRTKKQHTHSHETNAVEPLESKDKKGVQNLWSSYGIGVLHGLAGIAHFFLLLPVLGFENQIDGAQYVVGFGLGTLFAMTVYTYLLGKLASYSKTKNSNSLFRTIRIAGALFAIVIGVYWIYLSF